MSLPRKCKLLQNPHPNYPTNAPFPPIHIRDLHWLQLSKKYHQLSFYPRTTAQLNSYPSKSTHSISILEDNRHICIYHWIYYLTTNLAECVCVCVFVCVCAKCDAFLPVRSHFFFKLPEFFFRIAKFPCAAFGPLFACHCPIFFTKNNTLNGVYAECNSGPLK